jgi:transcriptional regulator with XRE-family HTH domain
MNNNEIQSILSKLDSLIREKGISKRYIAAKIGIPYATLKKWFAKKKPRMPLPGNLNKLKGFLNTLENEESEPEKIWGQIRDWWRTQHRYRSIGALADEIGWNTTLLRDCIEKGDVPPRLIIEKIAEILSIPFGNSTFKLEVAERKVERIKILLLILEEELRWFRDGTIMGREIYRTKLDPLDIGYISSLLVMLGEEEAFKRWLTLTTNRFNYFKTEGKKNEPQNSD